jgi:hypothetical protein
MVKNKLIVELEQCVSKIVVEFRQHGVSEDEIMCSLQLAYLWYCPHRIFHNNPDAPKEMVEEMRAYAMAKADELFRMCRV